MQSDGTSFYGVVVKKKKKKNKLFVYMYSFFEVPCNMQNNTRNKQDLQIV